MDSARILKRFFFCEQALIVAQGGWLAAIPSVSVKWGLPRHLWEDSLAADALRERVFELRYPSRMMEIAEDAPVVEVFQAAIDAPNAYAFVLALQRVFKPALLNVYRDYLAHADEIADGPSKRFLGVAVEEKEEQLRELGEYAEELARLDGSGQAAAEAWVEALQAKLNSVGGLALDEPHASEAPGDLPGRTPFQLAQVPARDPKFHLCRFYWPDVIDPTFPYGEGVQLQLRSAVSHFNEAWAVETAGAILQAFAEQLGWEFLRDAARWTYDEARHFRMGYERLTSWGFEPGEMPLGSYIYDSARGQEPIYRLGMLSYFETKNIGKKKGRARAFGEYHDRVSQHDMDFDWADETIHAHYGTKWLNALREFDPENVPTADEIRARCDQLVAAEIKSATDADRQDITKVAQAMIDKAQDISHRGPVSAVTRQENVATTPLEP
jgi:uncharacterized ferritin-like protein (DUF455 family)